MTADPPGTDDTAVASQLVRIDAVATAEHLAVYTTIAGELAARLDQQDGQFEPQSEPRAADTGEHVDARE